MHFDCLPQTHYVVISGSHSYGMATETSDIDVRGWCIPPLEILLSFHLGFEQSEQSQILDQFPWRNDVYAYLGKQKAQCGMLNCDTTKPIDCCIFSLKKFFQLASACNPNIVELLFVDDDEILFSSCTGNLVREKRDLFLSAKAKFTYTGYAISQLKRIDTHKRWITNPPSHKPSRAEYNLPEQSVVPADQRQAAANLIEKQVRLWMLEESDIDKILVDAIRSDLIDLIGKIILEKANFSREEGYWILEQMAAKHYAMSDNYIAVLQAEKKYHHALIEWHQYQSWLKNRNPDRAVLETKYGYDTKHASHLVRLMKQAEEILMKGTLTLKDKATAELLMAVRKGAWSYDVVLDFAKEMEKRLDQLYLEKTYVVQKEPNMAAIDALYQKTILNVAVGERSDCSYA